MKNLFDSLTVSALYNGVEGIKTLIHVYAKGSGVKIDNMWEIVKAGDNKTYPLEKVLRGLSKAQDTYVICNFDLQYADMVPKTDKKVTWLDGHK